MSLDGLLLMLLHCFKKIIVDMNLKCALFFKWVILTAVVILYRFFVKPPSTLKAPYVTPIKLKLFSHMHCMLC